MAYSGTNAPTQLDISRMITELDGAGSITKGCRFIVKIKLSTNLLTSLSYSDKIDRSLLYVCDAAEFPGRGFQTAEVRYYGPKQMVPSNTSYGEGINLSFICRSDTLERQFFDDWMDIINPPTSYHFKYPDEYWTDIDIFQYAEYGSAAASLSNSVIPGIPRTANPQNNYAYEPIYGWTLMKAWPVMVSPQQVTWAEGDALRLQVTFSYKNWKRQGDTEKIADKIYR